MNMKKKIVDETICYNDRMWNNLSHMQITVHECMICGRKKGVYVMKTLSTK